MRERAGREAPLAGFLTLLHKEVLRFQKVGFQTVLAPVLNAVEATSHPHNLARSVFVKIDGIAQPAPAPRFDRTPAGVPPGPPYPGRDTNEVLAGLGFSEEDTSKLRRVGAVA